MKGKITFATAYFLSVLWVHGATQVQEKRAEFSRSTFFSVMRTGTAMAIDSELAILGSASFEGREAFWGTLLMKKASLISNPEKKLNLFKNGRKKLELAIHKDSLNAEFRFLRMMIQEHAPSILEYAGDLQRDKEYIRKNFSTLPASTQQAVLEYSRKSKIIKPADF
jgi:hypothetical protein